MSRITYPFRRTVLGTQNYFTDASGEATYSETVALSDLPAASELTALFDQYKITGAFLELTYFRNVDAVDSTSTKQLPTIYWIQDHDNSATIPLTQMVQHPDMKSFTFGDGTRMKLRMKIPTYVLTETTGTDGAAAGYAPRRSPWLDTGGTSSTVAHGALKFIVFGEASQNYQFRSRLVISVSGRGPR